MKLEVYIAAVATVRWIFLVQ